MGWLCEFNAMKNGVVVRQPPPWSHSWMTLRPLRLTIVVCGPDQAAAYASPVGTIGVSGTTGARVSTNKMASSRMRPPETEPGQRASTMPAGSGEAVLMHFTSLVPRVAVADRL